MSHYKYTYNYLDKDPIVQNITPYNKFNYSRMKLIGDGAYTKVYRASNIDNPKYRSAIKKFRKESENTSAYREVAIYRHLNNYVGITPRLTSISDDLRIIVTEASTCDMFTLLRNKDNWFKRLRQNDENPLTNKDIGRVILDLMVQTLVKIAQLHKVGYYHFDVKPANFIVKCETGKIIPNIQLIDFNLSYPTSLFIDHGILNLLSNNNKCYVDEIVTFPYRPIELLIPHIKERCQASSIDLHSLAIIWIEIITNYKLIMTTEIDKLCYRDAKIFGYPQPYAPLNTFIEKMAPADKLKKLTSEGKLKSLLYDNLGTSLNEIELETLETLIRLMAIPDVHGRRPNYRQVIEKLIQSPLYTLIDSDNQQQLEELVDEKLEITVNLIGKDSLMTRHPDITPIMYCALNEHVLSSITDIFESNCNVYFLVIHLVYLYLSHVNNYTLNDLYLVYSAAITLSCSVYDGLNDQDFERAIFKKNLFSDANMELYSNVLFRMAKILDYNFNQYTFYQYILDHKDRIECLTDNERKWFRYYVYLLSFTSLEVEMEFDILLFNLKALSLLASVEKKSCPDFASAVEFITKTYGEDKHESGPLKIVLSKLNEVIKHIDNDVLFVKLDNLKNFGNF